MNPPEWDKQISLLAASVGKVFKAKPTKVAVIIEPRKLAVLCDILKWMVYLLAPKGWKFIVYVGIKNNREVREFIIRNRYRSIIEIRYLQKDDLTFHEYNAQLVSSSFWESMPFENVLIFQTDSVLLTNKLEPYLEYDYVGAPWPKHFGWLPAPVDTTGNGGLSLRKKSAMLRAIENVSYTNRNEDVFFSIDCSQYLNVCPSSEAMQFSVETMFYETPCGYHKPWKYLTEEQMTVIYERINNALNRNVILRL